MVRSQIARWRGPLAVPVLLSAWKESFVRVLRRHANVPIVLTPGVVSAKTLKRMSLDSFEAAGTDYNELGAYVCEIRQLATALDLPAVIRAQCHVASRENALGMLMNRLRSGSPFVKLARGWGISGGEMCDICGVLADMLANKYRALAYAPDVLIKRCVVAAIHFRWCSYGATKMVPCSRRAMYAMAVKDIAAGDDVDGVWGFIVRVAVSRIVTRETVDASLLLEASRQFIFTGWEVCGDMQAWWI